MTAGVNSANLIQPFYPKNKSTKRRHANKPKTNQSNDATQISRRRANTVATPCITHAKKKKICIVHAL